MACLSVYRIEPVGISLIQVSWDTVYAVHSRSYQTKEEAESAALLLAAKEPQLIGLLQVVEEDPDPERP